MKIDFVGKKDINIIKRLYFEFMDETGTGRPNDFDMSFYDFIENKRGYLVVVRMVDKPVGFVEFRLLQKKLRDNQDIIEITSLYVDKDNRSKGLGEEMVSFIKEFGIKNNCYQIVLYSGLELESAHGFYQKIGFTKSAYYFKMQIA